MIRDFQNIEDDIIRRKRIIKRILYEDPDIISLLNNPELDPESPDEYIGVNIHSAIHLPESQDSVKNFICFDIDDLRGTKTNKAFKDQVCTFRVFCHEDDLYTPYGAERHDLIGYCIRDLFNWSNILGLQLRLDYDVSGITDVHYVSRTLKFLMTTPNDLYQARMANRHYET